MNGGPAGWREVARMLGPGPLLDELHRLQKQDRLSLSELRRVCREHQAELVAAKILPELAPYWLAHHLAVQRP
jgi:hypothetical protein